MISIEQIEEWIREAQERPSSAALIIEFIGRRLRDLTERNEELLSENIELSTGKKVEELERKIASLEYQLGMIKRQLGDAAGSGSLPGLNKSACLVVYNPKGRAIRFDFEMESLEQGQKVGQLVSPYSDGLPPRMLLTNPTEELLFIFDSGRTEACAVSAIPVCDSEELDWSKSRLFEPRGSEELSTVLPIGRMSLFDYCVQVSRRGCVKKMMKTSFESHIGKNFIGAGVKAKPDRTCSLVFAMRDDRLFLMTYEGYLVNLAVEQLPYTIEEGLRLAATDYILTSFVPGSKKTLLVITAGGKVLQREASWLEPAESFRSKGQPIFSQARREAGNRCAGASAVDGDEWAVLLLSDGALVGYSVSSLFASGAVQEVSGDVKVIDFVTLTPQITKD